MNPPRLALWLLERLIPRESAGEILGDLEEDFRRRRRFQRLWYWKETLRFLPSLFADRWRNGSDLDGRLLDFRLGLRRLSRRPLFTVAAVLTVAIGVGATTAVYSVVHGVVFRPLPFPDSDRVVELCETNELVGSYCVASPPNATAWAERSRTFEGIGLGRGWSFSAMRVGERSQSVRLGIASPSFFTVFRFQPLRGRLFAPEDQRAGAPRVAIVGYPLWRSAFGEDPGVVGRSVLLDGEAYEVVGVLPADAEVPSLSRIRIWTPLPFDPRDEENRKWRGFMTVGRLAPRTTLDEARAEMQALTSSLALEFPETNAGWGIRVVPLREEIVGSTRNVLFLLLGAVALLYLVSVVDVANLFLLRGAEREREIAVNAALGAGRGRIARQILLEGLLLSCFGGLIGILLGVVATKTLLSLAPTDIPRLDAVRMDGVVLGFALTLSVLTALVFGLVPAWRASRVAPASALSLRDRGRLGGARNGGALVVAELALSLVLLVGAGLLARSFVRVSSWSPGFDRERLLTVQVFASTGTHPDGDEVVRFFARATKELRSIPSVTSVGATSAGPLFGGRETTEIQIESEGRPETNLPSVRWYDVDEDYFRTLGLPLRGGRFFDATDVGDGPPVAVVNETLARRYFPGDSAVGKSVRVSMDGAKREIVGVVGDVAPLFPDEPVDAEVYWPKIQSPRWATYFVIRTESDPGTIASSVRDRLESLDPDLTVGRVQTMGELLASGLSSPRFQMFLLGAFSIVALALATVGTYGVVAYGVVRRRHEIGLRMSLGASQSDILRMVLGRGMKLVLAGIVLGTGGALLFSRAIARLLHGVEPTDVATFAAVAALLGGVALAACYLPARRASRLDPLVALRHE